MREELSQFLGAEWGKAQSNAKALDMASTRVSLLARTSLIEYLLERLHGLLEAS